MNIRGEQRFVVLLETAGDLIEEQGWTAVTHRAVAAKAGIPLASTTYYFPSAEDLTLQAAGQLAERHLAAGRAVLEDVPARRASAARAARLLADLVLGTDPTDAQLTALLDRHLRAGRTPDVQTLVAGWSADLRELARGLLARVEHPADNRRTRLLVSALEGLAAAALADADPDPADAAAKALVPLLS